MKDIFIVIYLSLMLIYICYMDICYRRIPNISVICVAILSIIFAMRIDLRIDLVMPTIVIVLGFLASTVRWIGAGDVKLTAALLFSVPAPVQSFFIITVTLCGIPLAAGVLIYNRVKTKKVTTVPYGVAIVASYLITMLITGIN
ncbi:TPA: A24 family peptidase [Enterobacter hormaechei]